MNALLSLPFALKLATKDHHPPNHISFAVNHPGATAFTSFVTVVNPANPEETYESLLWPEHCVVGTPGNELIGELDTDRFDKIVLKGTDPRVEMYSAFRSPLRAPPLESAVSELAGVLAQEGIDGVVIVGLAGDYCVKFSAVDAAEGGWKTYVVEEGVRCVGGEEGWKNTKVEMQQKGIQTATLDWVKEVCAFH